MTHTCRIDGCDTQIRAEFLMCHGHWRLVPFFLQDEVNKQYRRWQKSGTELPSPEYQRAVKIALDAVQEAE